MIIKINYDNQLLQDSEHYKQYNQYGYIQFPTNLCQLMSNIIEVYLYIICIFKGKNEEIVKILIKQLILHMVGSYKLEIRFNPKL